jgi:D-alanyl-D-alanine carboxypeptidase
VEFFGVRSIFHIGSLAKFRYKLMFDSNQDSTTLDNSNGYLEPQDSWSAGLNTDSDSSSGGSQFGMNTDDLNELVFRGDSNNNDLSGNLANNQLYGLAGDDLLNGYEGDDLLKGGDGKDCLVGGEGNDTLLDDRGGDVMTGEEGSDIFWLGSWDRPEQPSVIKDFQVGTDEIKVGRLGVTFDQLTIEDTEEGAIVSEEGQALAVLSGVDAASLKAESFVFGDPKLADQLQADLEKGQTESNIPGATNGVVTEDGFTWKGASGVSNLEKQTPTESDDLFKIASITKTYTAATVLKVVESGKLSLDDTLGQWLPDIAKNLPNSENVTVRELLNGSGGIYNYTDNPQSTSDLIAKYQNGSNEALTSEESVAYAYGQPRFSGASSSSSWTYTNTGNNLAGLIVEKATGQSFSNVMRSEVLEPLGLDHTFYQGKEPIEGNLARGYSDLKTIDPALNPDGTLIDVTDNIISAESTPDGSLISNAEDVVKFSRSLFSGELLKPESLEEMLTFVEEGIPYEGRQFGLGVAKLDKSDNSFFLPPKGISDNNGSSFDNSSENIWSKSGGLSGYNSQMIYLPERSGATSVTLVNGNIDLASLVPLE